MAVATKCCKTRFLCLFAQEHVDFRIQELNAISNSLQCEINYNQSDYSLKSPFLVFTAPSDEHVQRILKRSVLIRFIYELWGHGNSYDELRGSLSELPPHITNLCKRNDYTFSVRVRGYNKKLCTHYQKDTIEWFSFLPINGRVELSSPTYEFHVLEDYGDNPNKAPEKPFRVFFGRLIGSGQRHLIDHYSLKTRRFIGNTSMDAQLSLIMANMAKVIPGSLIFDPFAGTGSIMVACAHYGGYVLGSDIDWSLAHGRGRPSRAYSQEQWRGKDDNVKANLKQYNLDNEYIDMLVSDASRSVWRSTELFDAIVTDPPYGVREGTRKVGYRKGSPYTEQNIENKPPGNEKDEDSNDSIDLDSDMEQIHYPSMCSYNMSDIFSDLVRFAAQTLVLGGHLVYWLPSIKKEFHQSTLPNHPCLSVIACSEQPLSTSVSRYLITMQKNLPWTPDTDSDQRLICNTVKDFRKKYFTT